MRLIFKNGKVIVIGYGCFKEIGKCNLLLMFGFLWYEFKSLYVFKSVVF